MNRIRLVEVVDGGESDDVTVRDVVVVWVRLSAESAPWIVSVAVPIVADPDAVRVRVLTTVPPPVSVLGENDGVTPDGNPETTERTADPVKLFSGESVTVRVAVPPWTSDPEPDAESEKSGMAVRLNLAAVAFIDAPMTDWRVVMSSYALIWKASCSVLCVYGS